MKYNSALCRVIIGAYRGQHLIGRQNKIKNKKMKGSSNGVTLFFCKIETAFSWNKITSCMG